MTPDERTKLHNHLIDLQNKIDVIFSFIQTIDCTAPDNEPAPNRGSNRGSEPITFTPMTDEKREIEYSGLINRIRKEFCNPDGSGIHVDALEWLRDLQSRNIAIKSATTQAGQWLKENGMVKKEQMTRPPGETVESTGKLF